MEYKKDSPETQLELATRIHAIFPEYEVNTVINVLGKMCVSLVRHGTLKKEELINAIDIWWKEADVSEQK